jgi:RNA polymerase sigma-70 factor (family 1)
LSTPPTYTEKELLQLVAAGDQRAFAVLTEQYTARLYAFALAWLKRPATAEEVTQDVLLAVWKHRTELPAITNFPGWLYVITRNRTYSAFRQLLDHAPLTETNDIETQLHSPQAALEYRELTELLHQGIAQLPPRRQQVFRMSRLEGKTYEEIAAALSISRSAVNQHIVESIVFLRNWLHQEKGLMVVATFLIIPGL